MRVGFIDSNPAARLKSIDQLGAAELVSNAMNLRTAALPALRGAPSKALLMAFNARQDGCDSSPSSGGSRPRLTIAKPSGLNLRSGMM
jgi:hypothetical protein